MNKQDLKKLQDEWYQKLKDEGFKDIEANDQFNLIAKQCGGAFEEKHHVYFEQCLEFLNSGNLKNPIDLFILEKHCEGVSNRNIAKLLPSHGFKSMSHMTVNRRLLKILETASIEPVEFNR